MLTETNESVTDVILEKQAKSIDELLEIVGGYGRFQKTLNIICIIIAFPSAFQLLTSYFTIAEPNWRCKANSSRCTFNGTFTHLDNRKCLYAYIDDWEYVHPDDYSIVTQFQLHCEKKTIVSIASSSMFIGWMVGSIVLGWVTDNFGRKKPLFFSVAVVVIVGFLSAFTYNIYAFIVCRVLIGFFLPGTFPQVMFLYMSEVIGCSKRAFAGLSIFLFVGIALCVLCMVAFLVPHWRLIYIITTAPFIFVLAFYFYLPESPRYLYIKGRFDEAMEVFQLIAQRNKTIIPPGVCIEAATTNIKENRASPLDLFRTQSMAYRSIIQSVGYLVSGMTFYALYLGAADISGHMYQDFFIVTVAEIPVCLMVMDFAERLGRKRTVMGSFLIGSIMCIALGFTPNTGKLKIARIIFAMVGKVSISATCNSFQTWSVELYPTNIRGQGMGFLNIMARLGASSSPFINESFNDLHAGAAQFFIGSASLLAFFLLCFLPETKGAPTAESEGKIMYGDYGTIGGERVVLTGFSFVNTMMDEDE